MPVYDPARSVVDAMRHRNRIGQTLALAALGHYLRTSGPDGAGDLQRIARELHALSVIRPGRSGARLMVNPTRETTAGRVYNDLRNSARRQRRATDEVMVEYVLERFLDRLATSPAGREYFVLKGGLLLAQFGARRMTRDIDILGKGQDHGLQIRA